MPGPKNDAGNDFASVVSSALKPPSFADGDGTDLPDGFPMRSAPHHRVVSEVSDPNKIDGVTEYDFTIHRDVFTIFRPWEKCTRCINDVASQKVTPPVEGDLVCPHVRRLEYEKVINDVLDGKLLMGSEQETSSPDGTIYVSLRWYEKKFSKARARAAARTGRQGQQP